jgi:voltage-gated potassium channel
VAALAYWTLEHGVNPSVHNMGDALYWAFITATTVGYGDLTPVTPAGRLLAGLLIFLGIGLVGFSSARLTSRWLNTNHTDNTDALFAEVGHLRREIEHLRQFMLERALNPEEEVRSSR